MKRSKAFLIMGLLAVVFLVLDQVTKYLTDLYLVPLGASVTVISGVLNFTSVHNTGAAFGMFSDGGWILLVFRIIASAAATWALIRYHEKLSWPLRIAVVMIITGAIGNVIDQIAFGYVRDMIEVTFVEFAVFNVADCFICVGAGLAVVDMLFGKSKHLFDDAPKKENVQ